MVIAQALLPSFHHLILSSFSLMSNYVVYSQIWSFVVDGQGSLKSPPNLFFHLKCKLSEVSFVGVSVMAQQ